MRDTCEIYNCQIDVRYTDKHHRMLYFLQKPSSYSYRTQRGALLTLAFEEEAIVWTNPTQQCLAFFLPFLRIYFRAQVRVGRGKKSEDTNLQFTQKLSIDNATIATLKSHTGLWVLQLCSVLICQSFTEDPFRHCLSLLLDTEELRIIDCWGGYVANDRRSRAITTGVT